MIRNLPKDAVSILAGRHEAGEIAAALNAAFWLHGRDEHTAMFLFCKAHEEFFKLAEAMGYAITPKEAKPHRVFTERDQLGSSVWRAHCDDLGADTSPYGYGATEAEAIADLERLLEEAAE